MSQRALAIAAEFRLKHDDAVLAAQQMLYEAVLSGDEQQAEIAHEVCLVLLMETGRRGATAPIA